MEEVFVFIILGSIAVVAILAIVEFTLNANYQEAAKKLIPENWNPEHVFVSFPVVVINEGTREIAFIDREKATVVNFSDIKSWRHHWTNNYSTKHGSTSSRVKHTTSNHFVKIVASGLASPSIIVRSHQSAEICDALELYLS